MEKFPDFEKIKEIAVPVENIRPGFTTLDSYPHHITDPVYSGEDVIRDGNLVVYIHDPKAGYYIGYIKGLNHLDLSGENEFKLVVRKVIPNEHSKRFAGRVYLEERLEVGDEFYFNPRELSRNKDRLYGRFLDYNVFSFTDINHKPLRIPVYLRAKTRFVKDNHAVANVEPIAIPSVLEYEQNRNRIFRFGD